MQVSEPKRRAGRTAPRATAPVIPETGETLTREVWKLGEVGVAEQIRKVRNQRDVGIVQPI